jgi:hypothetical protein
MPNISFKGKITDFHPSKNGTVKVTIETDLDQEIAKLLWLLDKSLDIAISDNQTTLAEHEGQ